MISIQDACRGLRLNVHRIQEGHGCKLPVSTQGIVRNIPLELCDTTLIGAQILAATNYHRYAFNQDCHFNPADEK